MRFTFHVVRFIFYALALRWCSASIATNSSGSINSNTATLTVGNSPVFTTQPISQSATTGSTVTFTVAANGSPTPTIQWRKNGITISGATGNPQVMNLLYNVIRYERDPELRAAAVWASAPDMAHAREFFHLGYYMADGTYVSPIEGE